MRVKKHDVSSTAYLIHKKNKIFKEKQKYYTNRISYNICRITYNYLFLLEIEKNNTLYFVNIGCFLLWKKISI